jgi:large subunit ribosomal protein L21
MEAYAVIETGGKQYRVKANDTIQVERLTASVGEKLELDKVLAVSDGKSIQVGTPTLEGAAVTTTVVSHIRGDKVINYKKKRRKGYERKVGHRQELTTLHVESIA